MSETGGPPPGGQAPGPQFDPQSAYPIGQDPPTYDQPQPGQPYHPGYGAYGVQDHPQATTALVLGLVSVVGGLTCGVPLLAAPFAWVIGRRVRREIRQSNGQLGGEGSAQAGMVLGIIGTVLLVLALVALVLLLVLFAYDVAAINDYGVV